MATYFKITDCILLNSGREIYIFLNISIAALQHHNEITNILSTSQLFLKNWMMEIRGVNHSI